jgi:hypothetical protein
VNRAQLVQDVLDLGGHTGTANLSTDCGIPVTPAMLEATLPGWETVSCRACTKQRVLEAHSAGVTVYGGLKAAAHRLGVEL